MTEELTRSSVSTTSTDRLKHFEPYDVRPCKVVSFNVLANLNITLKVKADRQWCVSKDELSSIHTNKIIQSDRTTQEKKFYWFSAT